MAENAVAGNGAALGLTEHLMKMFLAIMALLGLFVGGAFYAEMDANDHYEYACRLQSGRFERHTLSSYSKCFKPDLPEADKRTGFTAKPDRPAALAATAAASAAASALAPPRLPASVSGTTRLSAKASAPK